MSNTVKTSFDPITFEVMSDPVLANDGYSYDRLVIEEWFSISSFTSPVTGANITQELTSNVVLKKEIDSNNELDSYEKNCLTPKVLVCTDCLTNLLRKQDWHPPQIIALGGEGAGKSTILERITGYPVFPRAKGSCTRVPIRLQLRRGPLKIPEILYSRNKSAESAATSVAVVNIAEHIRKLMKDVIEAAGENSEIGVESEICVRIQSPSVPHVDIVDLPGLISVSGSDADPELCRKTNDVVNYYIDTCKETGLFLVVVPVTASVHQSLVMKAVERHGLEKQCLGILTKADIFRSDDEDVDDATGLSSITEGKVRGSVPLGHGWVLTSSRQPSGSTSLPHDVRLQLVSEAESASLTKIVPNLLTSGQATVSAVRARIESMYEGYLSKHWAGKTTQLIMDRLANVRGVVAGLGSPGEGDEDFTESCMQTLIQARATKIITSEMSWHSVVTDWINTLMVDLVSEMEGRHLTVFGSVVSATLSATSMRRRILGAVRTNATLQNLRSGSLNPVSAWVRTALLWDTSRLRLGRFHGAVDALVEQAEALSRQGLPALNGHLDRLCSWLEDPLQTFSVCPAQDSAGMFSVRAPSASDVACLVSQLVYECLIQPLADPSVAPKSLFSDLPVGALLGDDTVAIRRESLQEAKVLEQAIAEIAKINLKALCDCLKADPGNQASVYKPLLKTIHSSGVSLSELLKAGLPPVVAVYTDLFEAEFGVVFRAGSAVGSQSDELKRHVSEEEECEEYESDWEDEGSEANKALSPGGAGGSRRQPRGLLFQVLDIKNAICPALSDSDIAQSAAFVAAVCENTVAEVLDLLVAKDDGEGGLTTVSPKDLFAAIAEDAELLQLVVAVRASLSLVSNSASSHPTSSTSNTVSFNRSIYGLLRTLKPTLRLSLAATAVLNNFVVNLLRTLRQKYETSVGTGGEAVADTTGNPQDTGVLVGEEGSGLLSARDVSDVAGIVRELFPGEIGVYAMDAGRKASESFMATVLHE